MIPTVTQALANAGWHSLFAPGISTADPDIVCTDNRASQRMSAGVGIAVRGLGLQCPCTAKWDLSPPGHAGRLVAGVLDFAGGFLFLSLYLWVGLGLEGKNHVILAALAAFLALWDMPPTLQRLSYSGDPRVQSTLWPKVTLSCAL